MRTYIVRGDLSGTFQVSILADSVTHAAEYVKAMGPALLVYEIVTLEADITEIEEDAEDTNK